MHIYVNSSLISPASLRSQTEPHANENLRTYASPCWSLTKGIFSPVERHSFRLRIHHALKKARIQARKTKFWDTREKWSKELVLTMTRKGKNKKLITNSPGRKIRSRELKVCRFPPFKHFRRQSRHSHRPRTELSFAPLLPPALSSLGMFCSKHTSAILRKYFQRHLQSSLTCNYFTYRQKDLKSWKDLPLLSCLRRDSGTITPTWRPACELISWLFSPHREILTLCSHRWCELTAFPSPNPARPTLQPLLRLKLVLSSHRWTRSHVVHPGLPLRVPWSTSYTPHGCPHRTKRELCGEGTREVLS